MGRWLRPDAWARTVHDIDPSRLVALGLRGLILDLDNTLLPWDAPVVAPGAPLLAWLDRARAAGLSPCVVSNRKGQRVDRFCAQAALPGIAAARKPARTAFRRALALLGTGVADTAVIGDQVFTDVLGGNRLGLFTILVRPLGRREFVGTRVVRVAERAWLNVLARGGDGTPMRF